MTLLQNITFDMVLMSLATVLLIREALIVVLPDTLAGPQGKFIRTRDYDEV
jgi:hypothetical protein